MLHRFIAALCFVLSSMAVVYGICGEYDEAVACFALMVLFGIAGLAHTRHNPRRGAVQRLR